MHDLIFLKKKKKKKKNCFLLLFIVCYYMNEWKYNNITHNTRRRNIFISFIRSLRFFVVVVVVVVAPDVCMRRKSTMFTLPCIRWKLWGKKITLKGTYAFAGSELRSIIFPSYASLAVMPHFMYIIRTVEVKKNYCVPHVSIEGLCIKCVKVCFVIIIFFHDSFSLKIKFIYYGWRGGWYTCI